MHIALFNPEKILQPQDHVSSNKELKGDNKSENEKDIKTQQS